MSEDDDDDDGDVQMYANRNVVRLTHVHRHTHIDTRTRTRTRSRTALVILVIKPASVRNRFASAHGGFNWQTYAACHRCVRVCLRLSARSTRNCIIPCRVVVAQPYHKCVYPMTLDMCYLCCAPPPELSKPCHSIGPWRTVASAILLANRVLGLGGEPRMTQSWRLSAIKMRTNLAGPATIGLILRGRRLKCKSVDTPVSRYRTRINSARTISHAPHGRRGGVAAILERKRLRARVFGVR